ncbi:hypothetical protein LXL04_039012 [Taraxacum kok-saghyz]
MFRDNIRAYNTNFSFTSIGEYIHVEHTLEYIIEWTDWYPEMETLASLTSNPYVKTFQRLRDLGPLDNYIVTLNSGGTRPKSIQSTDYS